MKKLIAILLACLLMVGMVACGGGTEPTNPTDPTEPSKPSVEDGYSKGLAYELGADGKTVTITGIGTCTDTVVKIPATIDGNKVRIIGAGAFSGNATIKEVVIPLGVLNINGKAFENCTALETISIPYTVTDLGESAFAGCTALKTVAMEEIGLSTIGDSAFFGCTALTSLNLPASITKIGASAFENCENLATINIPDSIALGWHVLHGTAFYTAFFNDKNNWEGNALYMGNHLMAVDKENIGDTFNIKDGTVNIVGDVFSGTDIVNVYIPDTIKRIGKEAFMNCTKLQRIELGLNVSVIDDDAFNGCVILNYISIEEKLSVLGIGVFDNCDSLKKINYRGTTVQWASIPNSDTLSGRFDVDHID